MTEASRFGVSPAKEAKLARRLEALGFDPSNLEERFDKARGPGGQKTNKTSSAVVLRFTLHNGEVVEARSDSERSQALNRYRARVRLAEKLEQRVLGAEAPANKGRAAKRKQAARRRRRAKAKQAKKDLSGGDIEGDGQPLPDKDAI